MFAIIILSVSRVLNYAKILQLIMGNFCFFFLSGFAKLNLHRFGSKPVFFPINSSEIRKFLLLIYVHASQFELVSPFALPFSYIFIRFALPFLWQSVPVIIMQSLPGLGLCRPKAMNKNFVSL